MYFLPLRPRILLAVLTAAESNLGRVRFLTCWSITNRKHAHVLAVHSSKCICVCTELYEHETTSVGRLYIIY